VKVGDLVRLKAYPSLAPIGLIGTIIEIHRDPIRERQDRKVLWFGTGQTDWYLEGSLEKIND